MPLLLRALRFSNEFRFQKVFSSFTPRPKQISYDSVDMIPQDSRVEIDAKINAGYFTTGKTFTMEELAQVKGRGWEKWEDVTVSWYLYAHGEKLLTIFLALNERRTYISLKFSSSILSTSRTYVKLTSLCWLEISYNNQLSVIYVRWKHHIT
jgi:hypothetical protein